MEVETIRVEAEAIQKLLLPHPCFKPLIITTRNNLRNKIFNASRWQFHIWVMPLLHFGDFDCDSIANQFAVQSQRSLHRVSVESPFAGDSPCFATLRRLNEDSTETELGLRWDCAAIYSQSKLPQCESGITKHQFYTSKLIKKVQ